MIIFGEGFDYYRKAVIKGRGIASALRWGEKTERQIYGYWASGVYSNSDLVSNYEGLRFYLGLYEDTVGATGKALPALFAWAGDHWELRRTFDWRDYVNPLWDEVILPSGYIKPLRRTLREELARLCDRYARSPALWQPASPILSPRLITRRFSLSPIARSPWRKFVITSKENGQSLRSGLFHRHV